MALRDSDRPLKVDHNPLHGIFNHERHLNRRDIFKQNRSAALAEWRQLAA